MRYDGDGKVAMSTNEWRDLYNLVKQAQRALHPLHETSPVKAHHVETQLLRLEEAFLECEDDRQARLDKALQRLGV